MARLRGPAALVATLALASCASSTRLGGAGPGSDSAAVGGAREALREARVLLEAKDAAGAARKSQEVIESPVFGDLSSAERHDALYLRGAAALNLGDGERALALLRRSSTMSNASPSDWHGRLWAAWMTKNFADEVACLTAIARRWPETLPGMQDTLIFSVAGHADDLPDSDARLEMFDALFQAGWTVSGRQPSLMWKELALMQLERGTRDRAIEVSRRVTSTRQLIAMRVDRRFELVLAAMPAHFDIGKAAAATIEARRADVKKSPRSLEALIDLARAFSDVRRHAEVVELLDGPVARASADPSAYDDADTQLPWTMEYQARSLKALGRLDEAVQTMVRASRLPGPNGQKNVSQSIDLGWLYAQLDRPRDALAAIAGVIDRLSDYGRLQIETVQLLAATEMDDAAAAAASLGFVRDHQADSPGTLQFALFVAGRMDEGSQFLVTRLEDPKRRSDALFAVQDLEAPPVTPREKVWRARWRAVVARPDVQAAIAKVGRIEKYDIPLDLD